MAKEVLLSLVKRELGMCKGKTMRERGGSLCVCSSERDSEEK